MCLCIDLVQNALGVKMEIWLENSFLLFRNTTAKEFEYLRVQHFLCIYSLSPLWLCAHSQDNNVNII